MDNGFVDDPSPAEMLDNDPLEERRADGAIPYTLRIDHHDRPAPAHAEAWRFAALDARGAEQQSFTLE